MSPDDEDTPKTGCCHMLCGKTIEVDENGKALNFKLLSLVRPHMRAFHLSWFGFFIAFTSWFAFAPLMPTVAAELGLSKGDVANANIASISSTIIFRFIAGPMCDRFGARRVFAVMLAIGAIPASCAGLVNSAGSLIFMRALIGTIGCVFVPCQMWTTYMFAPKIVGSANAMAGGWGNLGGGFTYIIMPQLMLMFGAFGLSTSMSWRVSFIIPGAIGLIVAGLMWFAADDAPIPPTSSVHMGSEFFSVAVDEKDAVAADPEADAPEAASMSCMSKAATVLRNPAVWGLMVIYGCCFGVELAVNNQIGLYFYNEFKRADCDPTNPLIVDECRILTQSTAGLIASLFGLMNLFARGLGGLASDVMNQTRGVPGRLMILFLTLSGQAVFLLAFQSQRSIPLAMLFLVCFSTCTQMSEGATYGVVPYVDKRFTGTIAGIVGAGGNLGGVACSVVFKQMATPQAAYQIIAAAIGVSAIFVWACNVNGSMVHHVITKGKVATPDVRLAVIEENKAARSHKANYKSALQGPSSRKSTSKSAAATIKDNSTDEVLLHTGDASVV